MDKTNAFKLTSALLLSVLLFGLSKTSLKSSFTSYTILGILLLQKLPDLWPENQTIWNIGWKLRTWGEINKDPQILKLVSQCVLSQ
jgi:hypothetical protein